MKQLFLSIIFSLALAQAAYATCLSGGEQRAAIASGQAQPFANIARSIQGQVAGKIVQARLCRAGRSYVYRVSILQNNGRVVQLNINAQTGR